MSKVNTNVCIITGNLTRDAELRYTSNQKPVLTFAVAVNRLGQDNVQATDYFNCVFWGKTGEALSKWLTKGRGVLVRGSMRSRTYEAKDGHKVTAWELVADSFGGVELLGGGERQQSGGGYGYQGYQPQNFGAPPQSRRNDWPPQEGNAQFSAPPPSGTFPADNGEEASIPF